MNPVPFETPANSPNGDALEFMLTFGHMTMAELLDTLHEQNTRHGFVYSVTPPPDNNLNDPIKLQFDDQSRLNIYDWGKEKPRFICEP